MARLKGKVAVITGAPTGIALASAQAFSQEGATVFVTGRRQARLNAAVHVVGQRVVGVRVSSKIIS